MPVAQSRPAVRAEFIRQTYTHLAAAVAIFIAVEFLLFVSGIAEAIFNLVTSHRLMWLGVLGGFAVLGWLARSLTSETSESTQYVGLGIYILAEALIFAPLIFIAATFGGPTVIPTAGVLTLFLFAGLTLIAFTTQKDFTVLGGILKVGGMVALGLIVCSVIFGFQLGLLFSAAMVIFAGAAILHDTSKILYHYAPGQHVAAALELFASVALLLWYVIRIVLAFTSRD
jgi:FtsH-binding integral membrane protein